MTLRSLLGSRSESSGRESSHESAEHLVHLFFLTSESVGGELTGCIEVLLVHELTGSTTGVAGAQNTQGSSRGFVMETMFQGFLLKHLMLKAVVMPGNGFIMAFLPVEMPLFSVVFGNLSVVRM